MIWVIDDFYPNPDEIRRKPSNSIMFQRFGKIPAKRFHQVTSHTNKKFWWENRLFLRQRWAVALPI